MLTVNAPRALMFCTVLCVSVRFRTTESRSWHGAPCGVHGIVADLRQAQDGHSLLLDMSHDIRTPMNAIIGITSLVRHDAADKGKVIEYADKIDTSSQHLLGIINDVLDI